MGKYLHPENCKCGSKKPLKAEHDWYINAPEFSNCFWLYFRYNERVHTLNEVAELLDLSISAITAIEKKGFAKLKRRVKLLQFGEKTTK